MCKIGKLGLVTAMWPAISYLGGPVAAMWPATSYLGGLVAAIWAATSCLGAWRPLYKGAAARFAPFHLQHFGLERESVDLR